VGETEADPAQGERQAIELRLEGMRREIGMLQGGNGLAPRPQDSLRLRHARGKAVAQLKQRLRLVAHRLNDRCALSAGEIDCNDIHETTEELLHCGMNACRRRMFLGLSILGAEVAALRTENVAEQSGAAGREELGLRLSQAAPPRGTQTRDARQRGAEQDRRARDRRRRHRYEVHHWQGICVGLHIPKS
jgi:hypothetical protein